MKFELEISDMDKEFFKKIFSKDQDEAFDIKDSYMYKHCIENVLRQTVQNLEII